VQNDLDAARRTVFLEPNDGVRRAGQPSAQSHDGRARAFTQSLGYLRMV
jgi:hypothetical protein